MLKQAENLEVKKKKKQLSKILGGVTRGLKPVFPRTFLDTAV